MIDNNLLEEFQPIDATTDSWSSIQYISLQHNRLKNLDVEPFCNLRFLRVDGNAITKITGLEALSQLITLYWREQDLAKIEEPESMLRPCGDLTNLFLSGNLVHNFRITNLFANLRQLELASAGLEVLDAQFGTQMPNLRSLNLNYNAIRDLTPLLGIRKLQRLWLVGNRISRLRRTTQVLKEVGEGLTELDLRNNTMTVGFHGYTTKTENLERQLVRTSDPKSQENVAYDTARKDDWVEIGDSPYLLGNLYDGTGESTRRCLDGDTALRRRVYDMLVIHTCPHLQMLDGSRVETRSIAQRDKIWQRLLELGILKKKNGVKALDPGSKINSKASGRL